MYLRFAIAEIDKDSNRRLGIFHAARNLCENHTLMSYEEETLLDIRDWFNENLEKPTRFTNSKPPYYRKQSKAVSWFKDTAVEHLEKIRQMAKILDSYGIRVTVFTAERVGYVVYEDEFQIVAEPFRDTVC